MTQQTINHFSPSDSIGRAASTQFKYVPAGTGPAYWGPGDQVRFLITGAETGGTGNQSI